MEDPVAEIPSVVHALCTSPPRVQREALETYFLPSASFDHPLVLVEPLTSPVPSRSIILGIYRWYKILSPTVDLRVESVAFDEPNRKLYLTVSQTLTFWYFPWVPVSARLVVVLGLSKQRHPAAHPHSSNVPEKWYIASQTDLYQSEQCIGFFPVVGIPARMAFLFVKRFSALVCWVLATLWLWAGLLGDRLQGKWVGSTKEQREDRALELVQGVEKRFLEKLR